MTTWTSLTQEAALIDALVSQGRTSVQVLGTSTTGDHPIHLVTIALPDTPADAPGVLVVGSQHGNEPMGREGAMSLMVECATTEDPELLDLLGRCKFHFIPTANPAGFPDHRAIRGTGIDMNRGHLDLNCVEAQYVQRAITMSGPVLVIDGHEWPGNGQDKSWVITGDTPGADPRIVGLGQDLVGACRAALTREGIVNDLYPQAPAPGMLHRATPLRNIVSLLIETPVSSTGWPPIAPARRHLMYMTVLREVMVWLSEHLDEVVTTRAVADADAVARGMDPQGVITLGNGVIVDPQPTGYLVPSGARWYLDTFGLEYIEGGSEVAVLMGQPLYNALPALFDLAGEAPGMTARRFYGAVPPSMMLEAFSGEILGARIRMDGTIYELDKILIRHDGQTKRAIFAT